MYVCLFVSFIDSFSLGSFSSDVVLIDTLKHQFNVDNDDVLITIAAAAADGDEVN